MSRIPSKDDYKEVTTAKTSNARHVDSGIFIASEHFGFQGENSKRVIGNTLRELNRNPRIHAYNRVSKICLGMRLPVWMCIDSYAKICSRVPQAALPAHIYSTSDGYGLYSFVIQFNSEFKVSSAIEKSCLDLAKTYLAAEVAEREMGRYDDPRKVMKHLKSSMGVEYQGIGLDNGKFSMLFSETTSEDS